MVGDVDLNRLFGLGVADLAMPAVTVSALEPVTAGFVALVDCAPLIVAREKGFAAREGLDLTLVREPSWANIRDRVVLGHFDVAHMLAPMTIAATLGLGIGPRDTPLVAPFVLDLGGNAITVCAQLYREMEADGDPGSLERPLASAQAVKRVVDRRKASGQPMLAFGMTYPFSSHNYELRYWLASAGIDPDHDVRLVVVPPPLMLDAMAKGEVNGSCVGAPWPAMMVVAGLGHIVATTASMKPGSPEKVLGMRAAWAERNPDRIDRLIRALHQACIWCDDPEHVDELAHLLARPDHVGAPAEVINWSLTRQLMAHPGGMKIPIPDYIRFSGGAANRPRVADALWYSTQMVRWGQVTSMDEAIEAARITFRPDLYDQALNLAPAATTHANAGFALFDGVAFEPTAPAAYLEALAAQG